MVWGSGPRRARICDSNSSCVAAIVGTSAKTSYKQNSQHDAHPLNIRRRSSSPMRCAAAAAVLGTLSVFFEHSFTSASGSWYTDKSARSRFTYRSSASINPCTPGDAIKRNQAKPCFTRERACAMATHAIED